MAKMREQEIQLDRLIGLQEQIDHLNKIVNKQESHILALKEYRDTCQELFELSNDGIVIIQNYQIKAVNPSLVRMLRSTPKGLLNRSFTRFVSPEVLPKVKDLYERRLKGENVSSIYESSLVDEKGDVIPIEINAGSSVFNGEKADLVIIRNLAHIKRAEAEILRLRRYEETLLENVNIWLEMYDEDGRVVIWNRAAEEISGYLKEDFLGTRKNFERLYPNKRYRRNVLEKYKTGINQKSHACDFETNILCKNGQVKTIRWYLKNIILDKRTHLGTIVLGLDITARIQSETRLRESQQTIEALFNAITESIYMTDAKGVVIAANALTSLRWNKKKDEIVGHKLIDVLPRDLLKSHQFHLSKVVRTGKPDRFEDTSAGRYYEVTIYPVLIKNHKIGYLAVSALDVTERKKTEAAISQQNLLLEEKNTALREMIRQVDNEKALIEQRIRVNVDRILIPLIEKLNEKGSGIDSVYVSLLEKNLKELTSSFGKILSASELGLTQREIEISNMIINGLTSKQIARFLHVSVRTIEIHRVHIRKKLGLHNRAKNLVTYLKQAKGTPST